MENGREVKKSFCFLSVAYIVLGTVLLLWPDISVHTFCTVFGIGMIIFGGAHLILYFTKEKSMTIMQSDLLIGVICVATGAYILLKMEYVLEIIPFAMGIVALLGGIVKIQSTVDLKRLGAKHWYVMLVWAICLLVIGCLLVVNPFEESQKVVVILTGVSLLVDGIGNLVSIFWTGFAFRRLKKVPAKSSGAVAPEELEILDAVTEEETGRKSKIIGPGRFFKKKAEKDGPSEEESADETVVDADVQDGRVVETPDSDAAEHAPEDDAAEGETADTAAESTDAAEQISATEAESDPDAGETPDTEQTNGEA